MARTLKWTVLSTVLVLALYFNNTDAHGRMIEPPARGSMWRFGFKTPVNYNDNQLFCGGFSVQWNINGGRCGVCGDPFNGPRNNEAGGMYATGTIARTYREGDTITATLSITMNHGGYFEFRICPNNDPTHAVTESCLDQHLLALPNGQTRWQLSRGQSGDFSVHLVLPRGLTCSQCVLQWNWNSGANWGCDTDGCGLGHGPQEHFVNCADVAITPSSSQGSVGSNLTPAAEVTRLPTTIPTTTTTRQTTSTITRNTAGLVAGFIPLGMTSAKCEAVPGFKLTYQYADAWCETQCAQGNCPAKYCQPECLNAHSYPDTQVFG